MIYLCHACGLLTNDDPPKDLSCLRCGEGRSFIEEIDLDIADYDRIIEAVRTWKRAHYDAANREAAGMGTYDHAKRDAIDAGLLDALKSEL